MPTGLFSPTHIIFVLVIALIVLGPKRLPELARAAGRGIREFKDSVAPPDLSELSSPVTAPDEPAAASTAQAPPPSANEPPKSGATTP